jgi:hypothetical protein
MNACFVTTATAAGQPPDATKHVNYTLGMVLGVEDFQQEFAYLAGRDQAVARHALGYGTLCGLAVGSRVAHGAPELTVSPGAALAPPGQLVRVDAPQCLALNDCLAERQAEVSQHVTGQTPTLAAYVSLQYAERETDSVLVLGDPCRASDDLSRPSRTSDDFRLELAFEPPRQVEEDAVVELARWLGAHLAIAVEGETPATLDEVADALRAAFASPRSNEPSVRFAAAVCVSFKVPRDRVSEYVRAALRLWITELRPAHREHVEARAIGCTVSPEQPEPAPEPRVLLAEVRLRLVKELGTDLWTVSDEPGAIAIEEAGRPVLLTQRALQELLLNPGLGALFAAAEPRERCRVEAAGRVVVRDKESDPVDAVAVATLGGLRAYASADGEVTIDFDPPAAPRACVVKALPFAAAVGPLRSVGVQSLDAAASGRILLRVDDGSTPVPRAGLVGLSLMIEVSSYPTARDA